MLISECGKENPAKIMRAFLYLATCSLIQFVIPVLLWISAPRLKPAATGFAEIKPLVAMNVAIYHCESRTRHSEFEMELPA